MPTISPISFTVAADLAHSADVRQRVRDFLITMGFGPRWAERLTLVTDELFMNAVKYGSKPGDDVKVTLTDENGSVRIAVTDHGARKTSATELRTIIEKRESTHTPHQISGRGLAIITHRWTDGYTIEEIPAGGLSIACVKRIVPDEAVMPIRRAAHKNNAPTLTLAGNIDGDTLADVTMPIDIYLANPNVNNLTLDCSRVNYVNSSGIGSLVGWHEMLTERGGTLMLTHVKSAVRDTLELVGFHHIVHVD